MNEESLFVAALELTTVDGRLAFLDRECASDPAMRKRVEKLLAADHRAGGILERGPDAARMGAGRPQPLSADRLFAGRFRLRRKLGEGGMGEVWVADQVEPVRRTVALKVIRPGLDSARLLARFEAERQALALMDHPNIATVLDAGIDAEARPYVVMELIEGESVTAYCDAAKLSLRARLELFIPICHAVQHAHQKGIIHRDLKPSNILVGRYDGRPVPKVIDFGVAKATGPRLNEHAVDTEVGAVVGTLDYMAPEQADLGNLNIDTRCDVYSLGVLLYELLTGTTPLHRRQNDAGVLELLRTIREDEPPRPSARLGTVANLLSIAGNRGTGPAALGRLVRGDLDWIVMKCLEKDRNRRYDTADGLAKDIERYLKHEPVEASPPSTGYRLRKFARRHRGPVLAASLIALLLVGGIAGTTWGLVRTEHALGEEARRAEGERKARAEAEAAASAEAAAKTQAQERLRRVERLSEILAAVFTDIDPREMQKDGKPLRVALGDQLERAAEQLEGTEVGDPLTVANLQHRLGLSLLRLGMARRAIPLFDKSLKTRTAGLGVGHVETLSTMNNLARSHQDAGYPYKALPMFVETLRLRQVHLPPGHRDTVSSMNNLATCYHAVGQRDKALELFKDVLALRKTALGDDHTDTLNSMNNLALAYRAARRMDLALPLLHATLERRRSRLGADHIDTFQSMDALASAYQATGKRDDAFRLFEETLRLRKTHLGADHPDTLGSMNNLARWYQATGKPDEALRLDEATLKLRQTRLGTDHQETLNSMNNLATSYYAVGKYEHSAALHEEALKQLTATLGEDHPATLHCLSCLGAAYHECGKPELGLTTHQKAAAGVERREFRDTNAGPIVRNLILSHEHFKQSDAADAWRRKWLAAVKASHGPESAEYAKELAAVGSDWYARDKHAEAAAVLRESLAIRTKVAPDDWVTFNTQALLGAGLLGRQEYAAAEPHLLAGYAGMKVRKATIPKDGLPILPHTLEALVRLYESWNKKAEAAKWQAELGAVRGR